jgi:fatty acid synthase subunit alpha, fungi type/fatty acid synthase subunit beta, fungi type
LKSAKILLLSLQFQYICAVLRLAFSVTISNEGKVVKVKGYCCRNNQAVIEVISSFLYRGRFVDYENTFDTTEEPDYLQRMA